MSETTNQPRVLYLSHAPEAMYDVLRRLAEPDFEMLTLERGDEAEMLAKLAEADVVIVASHRFSKPLIEAAGRMRFVHHQGVGYQDTIDVDALRATGARLAITPTGTTTGVAEHTLLLTLAVLRRLAFADSELRRGQWHVNALRPESRELAGKIVGYIGMGRIGQAAAKRFKAFDATGVYFDPAVRLDAGTEEALGIAAASLDEVFARADVLTIHTPLTEATRHLVDARRLAQMKPEAIVINTARGPIVDERALIEALRSGRIAGAGLDVFEVEPPPADSPLFKMRNTVVTPHISAGTIDAFSTKMTALFQNLRRFTSGEPLENEIAL